MAVSGNQFTRIGAYLFGIGKRLIITAKEAALVLEVGAGYLSIINTNGEGALSTMTSTQGVASLIDSSEGISSIISDSQGVFSTIDPNGLGVNSGT